jgi:hypothetical protein
MELGNRIATTGRQTIIQLASAAQAKAALAERLEGWVGRQAAQWHVDIYAALIPLTLSAKATR